MKHLLLTLPLFFLCALLNLPALAAEKSHLSVELVSETTSLQPGQIAKLGLHFKIEKGWHIYWRNPGDAGLAPSVTWNLPPGFTVSDIQWPVPQRIALPSVMDYGYENEVLLTVSVVIPRNFKSAIPVNLGAQVHWLVCKETCIPGQAAVQLKLPFQSEKPQDGQWKNLFEETRQALPRSMPQPWKSQGTLDMKAFHLSVAIGADFAKGWFFPLIPNQIDNTAKQAFTSSQGKVELTIPRSDQLLQNVQTLQGVLVLEDEAGPKGYWVNTRLSQ